MAFRSVPGSEVSISDSTKSSRAIARSATSRSSRSAKTSSSPGWRMESLTGSHLGLDVPVKVTRAVKHPRVAAYALLSGGKDSMVLSHILASRDMLAGCVSFDTGISTPDWREFLEAECARQGWPLHVFRGSTSYEDFVREFGFPGPGMHRAVMDRLKGRALREFAKQGRGFLIASGTRAGESSRRFKNVREWNVFEGMPVWAPLYDWTTAEVWVYFHEHGLKRAPAYATLGISGDCLCGAFARPDERQIIADLYPEVHQRLKSLECEINGTWGCGRSRRGRASGWEMSVCVECHPSGTPESGTR